MSEKAELKKTAKILKALGNAYRLQIVQLLLAGEKNVSEINREIRISQPSLSQHLAKLKREGVLNSRRDQRQIYYFIQNLQVPRLLSISSDIAQSATPARRTAVRSQTESNAAFSQLEIA